MQKRMLLVAVALAALGAGRVQAGTYTQDGAVSLATITLPAQTFNQDTQGAPVSLTDQYDTRTTMWLWQPAFLGEQAPSMYVRASFEHNSPSVTVNAQGYNSSASGYFEARAAVDPYLANIQVYMGYAHATSNGEGPKVDTLARSFGGYVQEASVNPSPTDTITGVTGQRLRGQTRASIIHQSYSLAMPPNPYDPHSAVVASATLSERKVEATNILLSATRMGP